MTGFAERMIASFPADMTLPDALRQYFQWVEAQGLDRMGGENNDICYALIDPAMGRSCVELEPVVPDHWGTYSRHSKRADLAARFAPFCRTGGDGSCAALWIDDDGAQHIVHLGSGSGSMMACVLADDPVDFLRLLAIGYVELCWPDEHGRTPRDLYEEERERLGDEESEELGEFTQPEALRRWVTETFGVTIPETASELIVDPADMDRDATSPDPFCRWVRANVME